jgi:preprotein translocase subunit SecF
MNIIGHKNIFLTVSGVLVGAAVVAIMLFGFKEGIDFRGGTLWTLKLHAADGSAPAISAVQSAFQSDLGVSDVLVTYDSTNDNFLVRLPAIAEAEHQQYAGKLKTDFAAVQEMSFQSIGPSVGAELRQKSLIAVGLVLVGISLYIAFAFRKVLRPVSSWKYGWVTLITLFHDVSIPAGLLAVLGHYANIEIDGNFIVALLVVMGFSVHDTIVVFDRIRENLFLDRGTHEFGSVINSSVNQTLARSVNTSLTLILVLLALYFTGPANLHYFVLTLLVGVTTGIYSSIFVASPLLLVWQRFSARRADKR